MALLTTAPHDAGRVMAWNLDRSVPCFASAGLHSRHKGDGEACEGGVDCRVSALELSKCKDDRVGYDQVGRFTERDSQGRGRVE
jgi:hypothetical protein